MILTIGTKSHIYIIIFAVLCKVNGEVRVTGVIDISARSLNQVVYCLIIHIGGANACQLFSVLAGIICGNDTGTVKAVQSNNLQVLDLDLSLIHISLSLKVSMITRPVFFSYSPLISSAVRLLAQGISP